MSLKEAVNSSVIRGLRGRYWKNTKLLLTTSF